MGRQHPFSPRGKGPREDSEVAERDRTARCRWDVNTPPPRAVRSRKRVRRLWSKIVLLEDADGIVKASVKLTRCGRSLAAGKPNSVSYMISFAR